MRRGRFPVWNDAVATALVAVWPVAITLLTLWNPSRYDPFAVYSGLGPHPFRALGSLPTTDPNIYATSYTLGVRSASMLVHGQIPWWNPFEGLGAPLIGELQSAALFPFTLLLLFSHGSLVFHLSLEAVAGVATYWLLREFKCSPLVATFGGLLFATNGTFAWLGNAAFNPVCFLPLMLLGIERSRRAAATGRAGGWRWLAAGIALALLAGFIETAALGLIFATVIAVQRGWTLDSSRVVAYVRKAVGGLAAGVAIAAPALVAFRSYLEHGFVAEHAGNPAYGKLGESYASMIVSPYLFGRIFANPFPPIHGIWGAVGGYAGFALLALGVASLFGRRDRGLRIALAAWVGVSLADTLGLFGIRQVVRSLPVVNHMILFRYLPPTWELALVVLAALALRDLATSTRRDAVIALATGLLASASLLLIGISVAPRSVEASRSFTSASFRQSELIVAIVAVGLLLASISPSRLRVWLAGAVAVAEAAVLFAIPLTAWPQHQPIDRRLVAFLTTKTGTERFFALGPPSANFGSQVAVRQLNVIDLPVPKSLVPIIARLDPYESPSVFTGLHRAFLGAPSARQLFFHHLGLYEQLGVQYVVAPHGWHLFGPPRSAATGTSGATGGTDTAGSTGSTTTTSTTSTTTTTTTIPTGTSPTPAATGVASKATLAYHDDRFDVWRLKGTVPIVRAPACGVAPRGRNRFLVICSRASSLLRTELFFPGWTATVDGAAAAVRDRAGMQAVSVPKGRSIVELTYVPPFAVPATVAALVAVLALCVPWGALARRRRRLPGSSDARSGLLTLGVSRPMDAAAPTGGVPAVAPEPATGAVPVAADPIEPATSAVPVVSGAVSVVPSEGSVATVTAPDDARLADPPTMAVPVAEGGATTGPQPVDEP